MVPPHPDPATHPVLVAMANAPRVRRLTDEQRAELAQDMEDIAAGRIELIEDDDVPAWLEQHAQQRGEPGE